MCADNKKGFILIKLIHDPATHTELSFWYERDKEKNVRERKRAREIMSVSEKRK